MADVGAALDAERVEYVQQVVDVGVEGGIPPEVEVFGVDAAGADEVEQDDAVVGQERGENALPRRLVGAEAVGEDQGPLAGAHDADVQRVQ